MEAQYDLSADVRETLRITSPFAPEDIRWPLLEKLVKRIRNPETRVMYAWVQRLVHEYGYSSNQIDAFVPAGAGRRAERDVVEADLVVYRDAARRQPFIVIETKSEEEGGGDKQAASYARNLGVDYHMWSNGILSRFYRTGRFQAEDTPIQNIPQWLIDKPLSAKLPKSSSLPPFRDEEHLRKVVRACHDPIFFTCGHDPAKSFDELMKVLFVKLYDEREIPNFYEFVALESEAVEQVAARIRDIFKKSIKSSRYKDVFLTKYTTTPERIHIELDAATIAFIVKQFQGYSLVNTTESVNGADIKGTVFESMVGSTFRGELGAYFTPRNIAHFMVSLLDPQKDSNILDPACGSGGFLIMCIQHIKDKLQRDFPNLDRAEQLSHVRQFAEHNLFGVDINDRMARVSKMNMIMHGDGHGGIFNENGLTIGTHTSPNLSESTFDFVFSNPPFAGRETDLDLLDSFETARNPEGRVVSAYKSVPFVEKVIKMLKPGGRAALVLPLAFFNSRADSFTRARKFVYDNAKILALIGLPDSAFYHTDCTVVGALLFVERTEAPPVHYDVFIESASQVGYTTTGRAIRENDLPEIRTKFQNPPRENLFPIGLLKQNDRLEPSYYRSPSKPAAPLEGRKNLVSLVPTLAELSSETISRARLKRAATPLRYFEIGDTDKETGAIRSIRVIDPKDIPSRARWIVRANQILLPNHRNSLRAKRSPVLVPEQYDGYVTTSRFFALLPKVDPLYLLYALRTDFVRDQLIRQASGSFPELRPRDLNQILIPVPEDRDIDRVAEHLASLDSEITALHRQLMSKRNEAETTLTSLLHPANRHLHSRPTAPHQAADHYPVEDIPDP